MVYENHCVELLLAHGDVEEGIGWERADHRKSLRLSLFDDRYNPADFLVPDEAILTRVTRFCIQLPRRNLIRANRLLIQHVQRAEITKRNYGPAQLSSRECLQLDLGTDAARILIVTP